MRYALLAALLFLPSGLSAQFHVALPPALSADTVCASKLLERSAVEAVFDSVAGSDPCVEAHGRDSIRRLYVDGVRARRRFVKGPSLFSGDAQIRQLYGMKALRYFGSFASTVSEDQVYLGSSLLSGILGRVHFDFSIAQVVSAVEGETPEERAEIRDASSNVTRLISNGGSATVRLLMPVLVVGGSLAQTSIGTYLQGGALGSLSEASTMNPVGGVGLEWLSALAIRNASTYGLEGELIIGARVGVDKVDGPILPDAPNRKTLEYLQAAVGIRRGGSTLLSVLFTSVPSEFRPFVPEIQFLVSSGGM